MICVDTLVKLWMRTKWNLWVNLRWFLISQKMTFTFILSIMLENFGKHLPGGLSMLDVIAMPSMMGAFGISSSLVEISGFRMFLARNIRFIPKASAEPKGRKFLFRRPQ